MATEGSFSSHVFPGTDAALVEWMDSSRQHASGLRTADGENGIEEKNNGSARSCLIDLIDSDINLARVYVALARSAYRRDRLHEGEFARLKAMEFYREAVHAALEIEESQREAFRCDLQNLRTSMKRLLAKTAAAHTSSRIHENESVNSLSNSLAKKAEENLVHAAEDMASSGKTADQRRTGELLALAEKGLRVQFVTRWQVIIGPLTLWPATGRWQNHVTGSRGKMRSISMDSLITRELERADSHLRRSRKRPLVFRPHVSGAD